MKIVGRLGQVDDFHGMPLVRSLLLPNFKHVSAPINFEAWKQSPCGLLMEFKKEIS